MEVLFYTAAFFVLCLGSVEIILSIRQRIKQNKVLDEMLQTLQTKKAEEE